ILHDAGVDFGILYEDERNSGNDVRRVGEEGLYEMLVEQNMAAFGKASFDEIFTTDPHSLNTLRNEYPEFGLDKPVRHYTELLASLTEDGTIPVKPLGRVVTYHDPCYLARYNHVTDAPRRLLRALGCTVAEMPRNRDNTFCCGAGGAAAGGLSPGAWTRRCSAGSSPDAWPTSPPPPPATTHSPSASRRRPPAQPRAMPGPTASFGPGTSRWPRSGRPTTPLPTP